MEEPEFRVGEIKSEVTHRAKTGSFSLEQTASSELTREHQDYLMQKYGTINLDPVPDMNDEDPLNWPKSRKGTLMALGSFHSLMVPFTLTAIQCDLQTIGIDLGVTTQQASYLTSVGIAVTGVAPLFWRPLADRYGRRPVFLLSLLGSLIGNVGCAVSPTYATQMLCRIITFWFIAPAIALGSPVVVEMFFRHQRARYTGVWASMTTMGTPLGPLIFGFVAVRVDYHWIYWSLAVTNAVQLLLFLLFGHETLYLSSRHKAPRSTFGRLFTFHCIDPTPWTWRTFLGPVTFVTNAKVAAISAVYAMLFCIQILVGLEIPQIFPVKFGLDAQAIGLQYISIIIGTIVGELVSSLLSDRWMARKGQDAASSASRRPEERLWLTYPGSAMALCGAIVFLMQTDHATRWNVTPLIGAAINGVGSQLVMTTANTYALDCCPRERSGVGAFFILVRQIWGFIGPFWFPSMIANAGYGGSSAIVAGLIIGVSVLPCVALQLLGQALDDSAEASGLLSCYAVLHTKAATNMHG